MKRKRVWECIAATLLVAGLAAAYLPARMLYELWQERRQEALVFRYAAQSCSIAELRSYSNRGRNTSEARFFARRGRELLVEYGANVDSRPGQACVDPVYSSRTALHRAVVNGDLEVARALVQGGANLSARDSTGETPLDLARLYSHQDVARMLHDAAIKRGAAVGR